MHQRGTGKSTFIMNVLARYCADNNLKILIFSNRDILKKQNEKLALDNVDCFNYQYVEKFQSKDMEKFLNQYDIINFDEAHYFFKDSGFNDNTDKVFRYALKRNHQIKIFASATPEPLFQANIEFHHRYHIEQNYSYIDKIIFYDQIGEVLDIVLEDENKTLCFFSLITQAYDWASQHKDKVGFLCSKSNLFYHFVDKEAKKKIIEESKFDCKVLATTTVLDTGINILDQSVKNVIIDFYDPITIIQALGRKRIQKGEKITLYLRKPTMEMINKGRFKEAKKPTKRYAAKLYQRFLTGYFNTIHQIGYIPYWLTYFKLSDDTIEIAAKNTELFNFLQNHVEQFIEPEEVRELFSPLIKGLNKNPRPVTYNNFLKQNLLPFRIRVKRIYLTRTKKITKWKVVVENPTK